MTMRKFLAEITLCTCLPFAGAALAVAETGSVEGGSAEIWVDGPAMLQPGNGRTYPDVAVDNSRRSIFVWQVTSAAGGDGSDIFMRRFDASGIPLGDPALINTLIDGAQQFPRVAVAGDGSFLVIWQSVEADNRKWVRSQAFNASGNPEGPELLVNTLPTSEPNDVHADVAALRGGNFVVVWRSRNTNGNDPDLSIQARRVSAMGAAVDAQQFQVNSTIGQNDRDPAVTQLADGGFFVVWTDPEVHGRRFDSDGNPVGNDFQINTFTTGDELDPDVALGWESQVLVAWKGNEPPENDFEIRGRLYDHNLVPQGNDFSINTERTGVQDRVKVGDYGAGGFFVAWESEASTGGDPDPRSIEARIVTGQDQFAGPQFQLNIWTAGSQAFPGVGGWYGRVAVVWRSQSNADTNDPVITAQFWEYCDIFCDDLEWGTAWRWPTLIP